MSEEALILKPTNCTFSRTESGMLSLVIDGDEKSERVTVRQMFPVSRPRLFLSIRNKDDEEVGVIQDLGEFPSELQALIEDDMQHHYFVPEITEIHELKDEHGYFMWDVETTSGHREFYTKGPSESVRIRDGSRIFITDVEDCKYDIPNYLKLSKASQALLDQIT